MRIAALDLGSNSFHLLVVDARPDGTFVPVVREKEMLRLGDVVSREGRLSAAAMERAIEVVGRFRSMAEACDIEELVACATSAIREADNGGELVDCIYARTGVRVRVLSGRDEARLIFGAVRASVRPRRRTGCTRRRAATFHRGDAYGSSAAPLASSTTKTRTDRRARRAKRKLKAPEWPRAGSGRFGSRLRLRAPISPSTRRGRPTDRTSSGWSGTSPGCPGTAPAS